MKKKTIMILYAVFALAAGIGLAIWRMLMLLQYFDPYKGEFSGAEKPIMRVFGYVTLAVILCLASSGFVLRKTEFRPFSTSDNQVSVFSVSICGFVFLAAGILLSVYFGGGIFRATGGAFFRVAQLISYFALFGAAAYFIFSASVKRSDTKARRLLSILPTVFALAYLAASYINPAYIFNDPNRILCEVSLAALLLFFLLETKNTISTPSGATRYAVSLIAMTLVSAYILPLLLGVAFWEIVPTKETAFEMVGCGALFTIFSVLYTMTLSVKEPSADGQEV